MIKKLLLILFFSGIFISIVWFDLSYNSIVTKKESDIAEKLINQPDYIANISDWQEYRDNKLGFSIKYPDDIEVREKLIKSLMVNFSAWGPYQKAGEDLFDGISFSVYQDSFPKYKKLKEYVIDQSKQAGKLGKVIKPVTSISLGGKQGYIFITENSTKVTNIYLPLKNNQILGISYLSPDPKNTGYQKIIDLMVSSIKISG